MTLDDPRDGGGEPGPEAQQPLALPGWYGDPWHEAAQRWWDGAAWTGHIGPGYHIVAAEPADDLMRMILPIGRSGWAIAAGYLGLVSVLCVFAPFALITGLLALRSLRRDPELLGQGRAWFGVAMGGVFSVVLVVLLVRQITK